MAPAILLASSEVSLLCPKDHFWRSSRQCAVATTIPLLSFTTNESGCGRFTVQGGGKRRLWVSYLRTKLEHYKRL
jgi:hypothetical protein